MEGALLVSTETLGADLMVAAFSGGRLGILRHIRTADAGSAEN